VSDLLKAELDLIAANRAYNEACEAFDHASERLRETYTTRASALLAYSAALDASEARDALRKAFAAA
jgi:hypothetical protein